jgi:hypothetical protein
MCQWEICADRLYVITVIIAVGIPYSLASCLIWFPFLHKCIPFTSPRFNALPIVYDNSSKNAKVSSATTSFSWRHTNTSENNGYNAVAEDCCAGSHFVPRIRHPLPNKKVGKVGKVKYLPTIYTLRSLPDQGGDVCKVWFRSVQKCEFV